MNTYQDLLKAVLSSELNLKQNRYKNILEKYNNLEDATRDRFELLVADKSISHLNKKWIDKISHFDWQNLESKIYYLQDKLDLHKIDILTYESLVQSLKVTGDFPIVFYFQGDLNLLESSNNLSVVGSREILNYTNKILEKVLKDLSGVNISIVSGLALGVDSLAHSLALEFGFKCLAFVGSGLDVENFYPQQNQSLKDRIIDCGGLVCSEYPPGFRATTFSFPLRNRFIAAVSELTWVVQAGEKSGSLITAKLALEYGKSVATTPGSILDKLFDGNTKLLKDGAQIITEAQDILDLLNLNTTKLRSQTITKANLNLDIKFKSQNAQLIYRHLSQEPKSVQDLINLTNLSISTLNTEISLLELEGIVQNYNQEGWILC